MNKHIELIGIYGASGFGSEVYPLVLAQYPSCSIQFIDDAYSGDTFLKLPVTSFDDFVTASDRVKGFVVAIANSQIRKLLTEKCLNAGLEDLSIVADNSVQMVNVKTGRGLILAPFSCLTSNIQIGKSFHANIYSYVAHDCVIGDYVTFAPGVKCNGNVHIEDHAYIGTGAIIKQGSADKPLVIGTGAVVGMGAVVTKSVAANTTVIGNPAKPFIKP